MSEFTIEDAIMFAARHFRGKTDLAGMPYILHLDRVAARMATIEGKMAAWNHDTLEDSTLEGRRATIDDLEAAHFPPFVIHTIDVVTKRKGENYLEEFIPRIIAARNPLAIQVKLSDLDDNMDPARVLYLPEKKRAKQAIYARARSMLVYANV